MEKEKLAKIIEEEYKKVRSLFDEKKKLEKELKKLNENIFDEDIEGDDVSMMPKKTNPAEDFEEDNIEAEFGTPIEEKEFYSKPELQKYFKDNPEALLNWLQTNEEEVSTEPVQQEECEIDEMLGQSQTVQRSMGYKTPGEDYRTSRLRNEVRSYILDMLKEEVNVSGVKPNEEYMILWNGHSEQPMKIKVTKVKDNVIFFRPTEAKWGADTSKEYQSDGENLSPVA